MADVEADYLAEQSPADLPAPGVGCTQLLPRSGIPLEGDGVCTVAYLAGNHRHGAWTLISSCLG